MPRNPHLCKTIIRCRNCRNDSPVCVALRRGVPDALQCDHHHGGGGGGGLACARCGTPWQVDVPRLTDLVEDLLRRRLREWLKAGAVLVTLA